MIKSILFSIALLITSTIFSQSHWESIILESDLWKYLPAISEPDANWKNNNFNDDSWASGSGGIGYADDDDATVIDPSNSVYLRRSFNVTDVSTIEELLLDIDYDDAFVAYLNGSEIARSTNITDPNPTYNSTITIDREALMYSGGLPERHKLDKSLLINGNNILAIQIINISYTSSDLSARVFLNAQINSSNTLYNNTPVWFYEPENLSSNLPIVVINTNGPEIPDDPRITADMGIIYNGAGVINNITDAYNNYNGRISIETRGQSSQDNFPKLSYGFETQDALGENNNVSLLGMPEENDWILYAPYSDKSMLRNVMTFELGAILDPYCSRTAYCELIINDEYQGVYVLMEKIKKDEERVNIATLNPEEISGNDLTGGYIFKVDKIDSDYFDGEDGWTSNASLLYDDAQPLTFQFYYPKPENIVQQQRSYIENYVTEAENVLEGNNFDNPENGYNRYLNTGSFVDFLIISEISKEVDNYRFSNFFYKKKESKGNEIFAGPIWDYNLGYGNVNYWPIYEHDHTQWAYEVLETPFMRIHWWKRLMEDRHFKNLLATRWEDLRTNEFSDANIEAKIDSITTYLNDAQQRNYEKWPILDEYVWPNYDWGSNSYSSEVNYFENWLFDRLEWMDNNINGNILSPTGTISLDPDNSSNLLLTLNDDYFNNSKLRSKYFELKFGHESLYIDSVYWINSSEATVAIGSTDPNYSASSVSYLIIDDNILNGFKDISTNSISSLKSIPITEIQLKIYTTHENIVIECDSPYALPQHLELYNTLGQLIKLYNIEPQHTNRLQVDLNPGIYLTRLIIDGKQYTERIIIK